MADGSSKLTGGCQCGAVRYAIDGVPRDASICHCRMCQKAFGSYFAPLVGVPNDRFAWTRGAPSWFQSSPAVRRGFCAACGTPLAYVEEGAGEVEISLGSLDDPARVEPERQVGEEAVVPFFRGLSGLPSTPTGANWSDERRARFTSLQHPDHDTARWPPA